ncbi:MAG: cyclic nucleotide-binding domain-containing protein, partial [Deltaproteobacteria bacterium]|nr:cyclic nucleotide-binding domain-containing protein [Deltaproteobacteria bacterium]
MSEESLLTKLKSCSFFSELDDALLAPLAQVANEQTIAAGAWLFHAGNDAAAFYVILEGDLVVLREQQGRSEVLAVLHPGDVVAESVLLEPQVHASSVRAEGAGRVLEFPAEEARQALRQDADVAVAILQQVARIMQSRLRYASSSGMGMARIYDTALRRREHDLLGELEVPTDALYGIQTLRALQNFDITGIKLSHFPRFIIALAMVKQAAARANHELGLLEENVAHAIDAACQELIQGRWHGHFVVDMVQGGAGTSTNMNANEVIANRALELMGYERGDYARCHPNNHVNLSQSTNDVYPTAIRLATRMASDTLRDALLELQHALAKKGAQFGDVLKMGRTQLQDAVPMTLGQEFCAFSNTTGEDITRLDEAATHFLESNLGGTAIGTGINAKSAYAETVLKHLCKISGFEMQLSADFVE